MAPGMLSTLSLPIVLAILPDFFHPDSLLFSASHDLGLLFQFPQEIDRYACDSVVKIILLTKMDLYPSEAMVDIEDAKEFADSMNVPLLKCSAKTAAGVDEFVHTLIEQMFVAYDIEVPSSSASSDAPKPAPTGSRLGRFFRGLMKDSPPAASSSDG
jgi:hypothetical protein